jgi:hypothetical protein
MQKAGKKKREKSWRERTSGIEQAGKMSGKGVGWKEQAGKNLLEKSSGKE